MTESPRLPVQKYEAMGEIRRLLGVYLDSLNADTRKNFALRLADNLMSDMTLVELRQWQKALSKYIESDEAQR